MMMDTLRSGQISTRLTKAQYAEYSTHSSRLRTRSVRRDAHDPSCMLTDNITVEEHNFKDKDFKDDMSFAQTHTVM